MLLVLKVRSEQHTIIILPESNGPTKNPSQFFGKVLCKVSLIDIMPYKPITLLSTVRNIFESKNSWDKEPVKDILGVSNGISVKGTSSEEKST